MTMPAATALSAEHLVVEAGQERETELLIRNDGDSMDQFTVSVLGTPARWVTVEPAAVTLMPGEQEKLRVVYAPPRTADTRAGQTHVVFRIASHEDPRLSTVEESVVDIKPFSDVLARIDPPKRTSMYKGSFVLVVENRGNTTVECQAVGYPTDDADQLEVVLAYSDFASEPGTSTEVKVQAVPHKRFMRGEPVMFPFAVEVSGDLLDRPTIAEGLLTQNPVINKNSVRLTLAALALALLCGLGLAFATDSFGSENTSGTEDEGNSQANASPNGVAPGVAVPPGQSGLDGQTGQAGTPGIAGAPGVAGLPGAPGLQGAPGDLGPVGGQGLPGVAGATGEAGAAGTPGVAGLPGATGQTGQAGAPGLPGLQGGAGPAGTPGEPGKPGVNGNNGENGRPGENGAPGEDGAPGGSAPASAELKPTLDSENQITSFTAFPLGHVPANGPTQAYFLLPPNNTTETTVTRARYSPAPNSQLSQIEVLAEDTGAVETTLQSDISKTVALTTPRQVSGMRPLTVRVTCLQPSPGPCVGQLDLLPAEPQ